ncbi:hypothetical protein Nmel_018414 [Mimus melanotis]
MSVPIQRYANIRQSPSKLYMHFIERLQDTMEKQIANEDARNHVLLQLAQDNANEDCRKIISALPKENPSLEEIINACTRVGTALHNMDMLANSFAAALRLRVHCFICGQPGHVKANCPKKPTSQKKAQGQGNVNLPCNRCGKPGHETKVCKSRYHINGQLLKEQGNSKPSAVEECARTEVFPQPPAQAFVTSSQSGQGDQPAWMFTPQPQ